MVILIMIKITVSYLLKEIYKLFLNNNYSMKATHKCKNLYFQQFFIKILQFDKYFVSDIKSIIPVTTHSEFYFRLFPFVIKELI